MSDLDYSAEVWKLARIAELDDKLSDITIERLREKQTELAENGGCPCCLAGDEEGHEPGCELEQAEAQIAELEAHLEAAREAGRHQCSLRKQAEAELAKFKSRHTAAGCGMDVTTGSIHVMTTGAGLKP